MPGTRAERVACAPFSPALANQGRDLAGGLPIFRDLLGLTDALKRDGTNRSTGQCRPILHLLALPLILLALALLFAGMAAASGPDCPPPLVERQRYGFVAVSPDWPETFDIGQLRAGWAVDFVFSDPGPAGMDRALVIRTPSGYTLSPGQLGPLVDRVPGAMWLIGNEPDCIWQDSLQPEEYARIYHDLYTFIKGRDQTSQVAAGGIVQPTPLRLEYLTRVLAAYRAEFGRAMPVDLWHIHNAILNEERGSWGADIPPGISADAGAVRAISDNDNLAIFQDQIGAFRRWMADHGYAGYPLIVTEYGVLMPELYGFDAGRVNAFMSATFEFLEGAVDPALGDPNDGHRLVQRWAWFSLDVPRWDPISGQGFNGNLFDPDTAAITPFGTHYAGRTSSFPQLAYVDLGLAAWGASSPAALISPTQTISRTLQARIVNVGTVASGGFRVVLAYDGPVSGTDSQWIGELAPGSSQWLTFALSGLKPGGYTVSLQLDADEQVPESRECNNRATTSFVVPTHRSYVPFTAARYALSTRDAAATARLSPPAPQVNQPASTGASPGSEEYSLPQDASYPAQIALDTEGGLWITERDGNRIARFDPREGGTWSETPIPTAGSQPWGLALDQAGNVWFAETAANQIGQLDVASGTVSEYPIPTPASRPWDVAIGDDGSVWFTERAGNKIGRLLPASGAITEVALPTAAAEPTGIAARGAFVWVTEAAANNLAALHIASGAISEFRIPTPASIPMDLVLTGSGSPWLTERRGNKIAVFRASTVQDIVEISVRTADSEPFGIAMEGEAAVWFTERVANRLGRYSGTTIPPVEYLLPTPQSRPTGIVVDSAGCAWYTAPGTNRIGRLCLLHTHLPLVVRH